MHPHAFTVIEGLWFAQNLPCFEAIAPTMAMFEDAEGPFERRRGGSRINFLT
jgi:hypothetical protein